MHVNPVSAPAIIARPVTPNDIPRQAPQAANKFTQPVLSVAKTTPAPATATKPT